MAASSVLSSNVVKKLAKCTGTTSQIFWLRPRGPFLESPGNFSGSNENLKNKSAVPS